MSEDLCRICAERHCIEDALKIFKEDNQETLYQVLLITGVELKSEKNMPEYMCGECQTRLEIALEFRAICKRSQDFLRQMSNEDINVQQDNTIETSLMQQQPVQFESESEILFQSSNIDEANPLNIEYCNTQINDINQLKKYDSVNKINIPEDQSVKSTIKKRMRKKPIVFICHLCGVGLTNSSHIPVHINRHKGIRDYLCHLCPKKFYSNETLKAHFYTHTGERPYPCRYCDQSFTGDTARTRHEHSHKNERRHKCLDCDKAFNTKDHLKKHTLIHKGIRNYKCTVCKTSFVQKTHLLAHNNTKFHKEKVESELQES